MFFFGFLSSQPYMFILLLLLNTNQKAMYLKNGHWKDDKFGE